MGTVNHQAGKQNVLKLRDLAQACSLALAAFGASYAPQAAAENFTLDNGDQGQWSAGISFGDAWRTTNPDPGLYSHVYSNGGRVGTAGDGNQVGDLNYGKGDSISAPLTITGEVQLKHDNLGLVFGARAWYDDTLETKTVPIGNANNGYVANSKLSDKGFYQNTGFSGAALTNAYVFGNFEPVAGMPLNVKLGDQVVNWGESLFIPGINQFGAFNYQALVTPGATIKDALLPIPQIDANWGLGGGVSLEAFYQFTWVKSVLPGCGTYWSISDSYNCNGAPGPLLGDSTNVNQYAQLNGQIPSLNGLMASSLYNMPAYHPNFQVSAQPDIKAKSTGQAGLSMHVYADSIETDFGFYAAAYSQRTPILDIYKVATPNNESFLSGTFNGLPPTAIFAPVTALAGQAAAAAAGAQKAGAAAQQAAAAGNATAAAAYAAQAAQLAAGAKQAGAAAQSLGATVGALYPLMTPLTAGWDYAGSTIKEVGVSAATTVGGWSLGGEASITKDISVQLNPGDMIVGDLMGNPTLPKVLGTTGAFLNSVAGPLASWGSAPTGTLLKGYDLHNKAQIQINTAKVFSQVAGAESLTLVGEVGVQKWSGIGDPNTPGNLRYGRGFAFGYATSNPTACTQLNPNSSYCSATGFDTPSAWGYRVQAELSYPNVIAGWNLKPKLFWAQDVHGYSADGIFSQDHEVLGLTLRADYNSKYYAQVTYTTFNHDATYDVLHDRDNIALVAGINF